MREIIDGMFSYTVGLFATFSTALWMNANEITTVGGLLVLALRLYVDGSRAYRKFKAWRRGDE